MGNSSRAKKQDKMKVKKQKTKEKSTKRPSAIEKARKDFLLKKQQKSETREQKDKERNEALARAEDRKKQKAQLSKKLNKRSKKGQPFMNVRMEQLLDKIERNPDRYKMANSKVAAKMDT